MGSLSLSNKRRYLLSSATSESSNMAAEEVESNDDLLVSIVVRLPERIIFRFRSVSKRWNEIISTPFFLQTHHNIKKSQRRLLAYIQTTSSHINMVPLPPSKDHNIDTSVKLDHSFVNSSNGLILCESHVPPSIAQYHIINPLTHKSVLLPPNKDLKHPVMTLMCEENARDLVLSYKVIAACSEPEGNTLVIETFSSNTWEWTTSEIRVTRRFDFEVDGWLADCGDTLVVNGIIHWCTYCDHVAVYDSNQEETEASIQMIQLPCNTHDGNHDTRLARASRDDSLWFCDDIKKCVRVWMLPNTTYSSYRKQVVTIPGKEWMLMHKIDYQSLYKTIVSKEEDESQGCVINTNLAGLVPWESPLVALLRINDSSIYHCNLESMDFERVRYPVVPYVGSNEFHPYMESLCLSSYAF